MAITESGEVLSTRQFWKRLKSVLKADRVMDGSGHLSLHFDLPWPLSEPAVAEVQSRTIEALSSQGLDGFDEEKARARIATILRTIARPARGKPQPKPRPQQQRDLKKKKPKQQQRTPDRQERIAHHPQRPAPVIQVTIKKARNFHYPRDLPAGDKS